MDEFLRRQAARRILIDQDGKLRGRLTPNELLALWCPYDGTDITKRRRIALAGELRRAIDSGAIEVDRESITVTKAAPAGGWAVPFGADFRSDLDELHARTAPRPITTVAVWVSPHALRAWLVSLNAWPPEVDGPLREWWPNETLPSAPGIQAKPPRGKELLGKVKELEDAGWSTASAMQEIANRNGVTLAKVKSARYPKKDATLPKASTVGNSRKKQVPQQH